MRNIFFISSVYVAVVLVWGAAPAGARDVFVNNRAGDDRQLGHSSEMGRSGIGPVRTITRALQLAGRGGRVVLADTDQPYRESISLSGGAQSGYAGRPFTIVGGGATLDGSRAIPPDAWQHSGGDVFRCQAPTMAHQMLFLDGQPVRRRQINSAGEAPAGLAPLEWALLGGRIYLRVEEGRLPASYALRYAGLQTGITLYQVEHVEIVDLVVQGFSLDGVNAHDGVVDARLVGLNCRANGRSGVSVGGTSQLTLDACQLYDNGRVQFRIEGLAKAWLEGTQLDPGTAPATSIRGGQLFIDGQRAPGS